MKVEKQLQGLNTPYSHVYTSSPLATAALVNAVGTGHSSAFTLHSMLSDVILTQLIQSFDVLCDSAACDAAMPNLRIIPRAWWARQREGSQGRDNTCSNWSLRRVATALLPRGVLHSSERIVYDAHEAVVWFFQMRLIDLWMNLGRCGRTCPRLVIACEGISAFSPPCLG